MKKLLAPSFIALLLTSGAIRLQAANLVLNGDFSDPQDFANWNVTGRVDVTAGSNSFGESFYPSTNAAVFNAGDRSPDGTISQTIATAIGQHYNLAFTYGTFDGTWSGMQQTMLVSLSDGVNGNPTLLTQSVSGPMFNPPPEFGGLPPSIYSFEFVADTAATTLIFADDPNNRTVSVDGVLSGISITSVESSAVPDRSSTAALLALAVAGFGLLSIGNRRFAVAVSRQARPFNRRAN